MPPLRKSLRWPDLVDQIVMAHLAARTSHLDLMLEEPFDFKTHSTRVEEGSRVAYSKRFLKSIGCRATDPLWFARGRVLVLKQLGKDTVLAVVKWTSRGGLDLPSKVNTRNLAPVGPNLAFAEGQEYLPLDDIGDT